MRDSPCTPRLRSVSSYGNIRAVTTARNLNKSLQNLSLTEEREMLALGVGFGGGGGYFPPLSAGPALLRTVCALRGWRLSWAPPVTMVPRAGASLALPGRPGPEAPESEGSATGRIGVGGEPQVPVACRRLWDGEGHPASVLTCPRGVRPAGSSAAFSPGNLSTSSSASSTLGSPENEEHILSFETVDKMRRVSSYSALNSLIGERAPCRPRPHLSGRTCHAEVAHRQPPSVWTRWHSAGRGSQGRLGQRLRRVHSCHRRRVGGHGGVRAGATGI